MDSAIVIPFFGIQTFITVVITILAIVLRLFWIR